jgi:putative transposase
LPVAPVEESLVARKGRFAPAEFAHHVVNRGNDRRRVFLSDSDYDCFRALLAAAVRRHDVRLYSYCLMPNHFHLIAQPGTETALSAFMQWVTCRYACSFRQHTGTVGHGHVFQRRFWNAPLRSERAFTTVMRYVEANPCRAALVARAEEWAWSSLREREQPGDLLSPLPILLPHAWPALVNAPLPDGTLARIRRVTVRAPGRPLPEDAEVL